MKVLIAYYSRTGYTRRVAEQLAARLQATLSPITEARSRLGFLGYQRCIVESVLDRDAAINPATEDPAQYDLVVLGTPVWAWHLSSPVRAFARRHAASVNRCAFFCTMGGAGADKALAALERCLGQAPRATLALTDREIDDGSAGSKIDAFVAALQLRDAASASARSAALAP